MKKSTRLRVLLVCAIAATLSMSAAPAMAASPRTASPANYTCAAGEIPSGTYANVSVTGPCTVGVGAVIDITGNVTVAAGASLDAQSASATISIARNVTASVGSFLGLGCQPPSYTGNSAHECIVDPEGVSAITVGGNVTANGAMAVMLNGITVHGKDRKSVV